VLAQGVNLEIPYEMVEVPLDTAGANSITYEATSVRIDPAKYDGIVNVYFEVDVYAYGGGNKTITLVDESAVQYTSITTGSVGVAGIPKRLRSASFTLNAGARTYKVKLGKNVTIYRARILIRQTAATKTVVQIPFLNWENRSLAVSTELGNAYIILSVTSNYEVQISDMRYRWRKDSAQYATISTFRWDVLANVTAANTTGYVSLFNSTHNTQIAESELSWTETAITRKSVTFAGNATNFAELDDFQPLGKRTTTSGGNLLIYKADLYIELTSLSRAEVYQRVGGRHNTGGFDEIFNDGHVLYDATRYSNPIVSFEAVGVYTNTDPPANYAVYLYDTASMTMATPEGQMSLARSSQVGT